MKFRKVLVSNQKRSRKLLRNKTKVVKMLLVAGVLAAILIAQCGCTQSLTRASMDFGQGARMLGGLSDVSGAAAYFNER